MKVTIKEIGDYSMSIGSLSLEKVVGNTTVKIDTEVGNFQRAIYDETRKYIANKLETSDLILSKIDEFRALFNRYQNNKEKDLAISLGSFVVDTIFNVVATANAKGVDVFNVSVEGQEDVVAPRYSQYSNFVSVLDEPQTESVMPKFAERPVPQVVEETVKKKQHQEVEQIVQQANQELNQVEDPERKQQLQKVQSQVAQQEVRDKMEFPSLSGDGYIEVGMKVLTGGVDTGSASALPYSNRRLR